MNSRHRYALAFSLALLPILVGAGLHIVEEDRTEVCSVCSSAHKIQVQHWNVWGVSGHRTLRDGTETRMLLLRDFPEFHCDHNWSSGFTKRTGTWHGPVRLAVMRMPPAEMWKTMCCTSRLGELLSLYEDSEWFRFLVNDAVDEELVTRGQVAAWFKANASPASGTERMDHEDIAAFKKLDEILKRAQPRSGSFAPLEDLKRPHFFE